MHWSDVVSLLVPVVKPLIIAGVVWLGTLISNALLGFVKAQKWQYAHTLAGIIVRAIEDQHIDKMDGSTKLDMAIEQLARKINLPQADIEDIVRSAYQATIVPLDALKNVQAASPTLSSAPAAPLATSGA